MKLQNLERHQAWIYLAAILSGLVLGSLAPGISGVFEALLWPVLGLMLFTTFAQMPLAHLPRATRDRRFIGTLLSWISIVIGSLFLIWTAIS